VNIELVVVDNGSADGSLGLIVDPFPDARIVRNIANEGFCRAHNQAIRLARGEYYLPLNPDVIMLPDYIATLVESLEPRPECGMAGGKLWLRAEDDSLVRIDSTGLFIDRRRRQYLRGHGEVDQGQYDLEGEVFGMDGAAPLYRRTMLEDIQVNGEYFDEAFFVHKEDVDLSWRARLLGWRCWYVPEARAFHQRSFRPGHRRGVASRVRVHAVKNRYLLLLKNESWDGWRRDWLRMIWYDLRALSYLCLFEQRSLWAFILLRRVWARALDWRQQIWQRVQVDPLEMLAWFR
jgi:GT2 family glycosyltransferase